MTYSLESMPRVASNKGDNPIESMMTYAVTRLVDLSLYVKSWQTAPAIRTIQRINV